MEKTMEERRKMVEEELNKNFFLMKQVLVKDSLENRLVKGVATGYSLQLANLSYRGVWLSTIEGIELTVDGEVVPHDHILVELNGNKYSICDLVNQTETFWGAKDACRIIVYRVGGLAKGPHKVKIVVLKRSDFGHSYGEGTEGYEEAAEFHMPLKMSESMMMEIR